MKQNKLAQVQQASRTNMPNLLVNAAEIISALTVIALLHQALANTLAPVDVAVIIAALIAIALLRQALANTALAPRSGKVVYAILSFNTFSFCQNHFENQIHSYRFVGFLKGEFLYGIPTHCIINC